MLHWLKRQYRCPVVAFVADVGQEEDFDAVRAKAIATGADEVMVSDLKEEFVREFVFPAVQAHAVYEGEYLLGTSLARPPIAREQVRVAKSVEADAVAHGSTGKGNDQVRFELTYQALAPELVTIAPWRTWQYKRPDGSHQLLPGRGDSRRVHSGETLQHGPEPDALFL